MSEPIHFYFDFSSPYAYFGAEKIEELAEGFGREVDWHPVLLGVIMKETGNKALHHQPMKGEYSEYDWDRLARFMDMPWKMPETFPIASLAAARAFYWLKNTDAGLAKKLGFGCLQTYFGEGRDISSPEAIAEIGETLGVDGGELLVAVQNDEIKQRVKDETQGAIEAGVFGSPFYIVDGEPFWGSDRLWMIKRWLKSGGW